MLEIDQATAETRLDDETKRAGALERRTGGSSTPNGQAAALRLACTRFWLIRHALVEEGARAVLYGTMDVALCPHTMIAQRPAYRALAACLPPDAAWLVSPLRRTADTAACIQNAGYKPVTPVVEPGLTEQHLGRWQGIPHADLPGQLSQPAHAFWPLGATEMPPGGESMDQVVERVGATLERLANEYPGRDVVAVSHGGAIRAATAHALGVGAAAALHLSVQNLSLTVLERSPEGWRVVTVNEVVSGRTAFAQ